MRAKGYFFTTGWEPFNWDRMMKITIFGFLLMLSCSRVAISQSSLHTFTISDGEFLLDGKPFQIISGEMHFARIPEEYWRYRLKTARAMGLNTIATYIFWNYHEREKGVFNFRGNADVAKFVKTAQEESLWVIIRPSPYGCAEWEFGGYPWWLLKEKDLKVRSKDPNFTEMCRKYYHNLGEELASLQITRGGPIIMLQLENEYGSYGSDKEYLTVNKNIIRESGFDVELYTCDGPSQMPKGCLDGLLPAVNGLDNVREVKELINRYHGNKGPYFIAEWYPAWFDSWGKEHHVVPAEEYVNALDTILANRISINMYMAHGGTTRGFMNGANFDDRQPYLPQVSSYDYDAPIDEAGNATHKYMAFRGVIEKHLPPGASLPDIPERKKAILIPRFKLPDMAAIFENLGDPVGSIRPLSFEDIGQGYGYVLYRTKIQGPAKGKLDIVHLRDFGLIFINGKRVAVLDRRLKQESTELELPVGEATLDIFVENLGRINYGPYLNENRKGITEKVTFNKEEITGWEIYGFPMNDFSNMKFRTGASEKGPVARRGTFDLKDTGDTYLDMRAWGKGCAWINGRSIGRFWNIGPQQTLYVPGPWLVKGRNELIIFELLSTDQDEAAAIAEPVLDELNIPAVSIKAMYDRDKGGCALSVACRDKGVKLYYTLDSSEPTVASHLFKSELLIKNRAKFTARGYKNGLYSESVVRAEVYPTLSTGKEIKTASPFSPRYPAGGKDALADGIKGSLNFRDGFWQGYEAVDLDAVIDLGLEININKLSAGFLQETYSWIFYPKSVEYFLSEDGKNFIPAGGRIENPVAAAHEEASRKDFTVELNNLKARYVRVLARNVGLCPPWHPGAGGKAWLFIDEIVVE